MRRVFPSLSILAALAMAGVSTTAFAIERDGWRLLGVPGVKESAIGWQDDDTMEVISDSSVAFYYREVMPETQTLSWRWRVMDAGVQTDLRTPGEDDRPVALHLWFPKDDESGSLFGWAASLLGYPPVGRAITYVWGGTEPRGTAFINPHLADSQGMIIVLRTTAASEDGWAEETVDFAADYERYFGGPSPKPSHIAISGDSDDLGGLRSARISDLRFGDPDQEQ
ncbi:MAG: DUF3047 domain-containing protein [Candidatus Phaeomarinobacter sp.]